MAQDTNHDKNSEYTYDTSKFEHSFSGWSIWIEPEQNDTVDAFMKELQTACGGEASGAASFVPHVTLLYNLPPLDATATRSGTNYDDYCPQQKLQACWDQFLAEYQHTKNSTVATSDNNNTNNGWSTLLRPTSWFYFHYPKSADDGKGFGCSIALLLIEPSDWLTGLQESCRQAFGPDERNKFIPHLSLVYAPEDRSDFLQEYVASKQTSKILLVDTDDDDSTKRRSTFNGLAAKYLSLWSTQGKIQDWYRIIKISIPE